MAVELPLVGGEVVDQLALQVFAPQERLGHAVLPARLDLLQHPAFVGGQFLAADERPDGLPVRLGLPGLVRLRLPSGGEGHCARIVALHPAEVRLHPLKAQVDRLEGLDRLAVLLGFLVLAVIAIGGEPPAGEPPDALDEALQRRPAVLAHRRRAQHKGPGIEGARDRVPVPGARHPAAGQAREGRTAPPAAKPGTPEPTSPPRAFSSTLRT